VCPVSGHAELPAGYYAGHRNGIQMIPEGKRSIFILRGRAVLPETKVLRVGVGGWVSDCSDAPVRIPLQPQRNRCHVLAAPRPRGVVGCDYRTSPWPSPPAPQFPSSRMSMIPSFGRERIPAFTRPIAVAAKRGRSQTETHRSQQIREPLDHRDCIDEVELDRFRALAYAEGGAASPSAKITSRFAQRERRKSMRFFLRIQVFRGFTERSCASGFAV